MKKALCMQCGSQIIQTGDKVECPKCGANFQVRCPKCFATCTVTDGKSGVCNCGWTC